MSKKAREAAARARASMRRTMAREENESRLTVTVSGVGLGVAQRAQALQMVPALFGSRILTVGLVAGGLGMVVPGRIGRRLVDVAVGCGTVAGYVTGSQGFDAVAGHHAVGASPQALPTPYSSQQTAAELRELAAEVSGRDGLEYGHRVIAGDDDDDDGPRVAGEVYDDDII